MWRAFLLPGLACAQAANQRHTACAARGLVTGE
jgi:hypothetical protein